MMLRSKRLLRVACLLGTGLLLVYLSGYPAQWNLQRAALHLQRQQWDAAESNLNWAQRCGASEPEVLFLRLRRARLLGEGNALQSYLARLQELNFDFEKLRLEVWLVEAQSGNLDNLDEHLSNLLVAGDDLQAICEAFVLGCLQRYRLEDAHQILTLWESDFPKDAQPHFLRARLLEHSSNLESAERSYRTALELNPQHAAAAYGLGRILMQQQKQEEALPWFRLCATENLAAQPGLVGLSRCYRELGQLDRAEEVLKQADRETDSALIDTAWRLVGETRESTAAQLAGEWGQLELARDNFQAAADRFEDALSANPHAWKLRYHLGTALMNIGETERGKREILKFTQTKEALARCDPMIDRLRQHPDDVEARYEVGSVMLEHVSPNQGLVWLNSVLRYDSMHYPTHLRLAEYYAAHESDHPAYPELKKKHRTLANRLRPPEVTVQPDVPTAP